MSLGIQVVDKCNDFNGINDQIFGTRKNNCNIYITQMQPVSGIYDSMEMTTIILNGNVQLTFYVGLSALNIILVLTFSFRLSSPSMWFLEI